MSTYAEWQPQYAELDIATFPVKNKRPCVKGWQKVGTKVSAAFASKFAAAEAFGFQCGRASGVTVLDIDSPDTDTLDNARRIFGESPVLWRTGSGNYAMPFRYNGE